MARSEGFEPPTPSTGNWCSIQLSYERILARSRPVCLYPAAVFEIPAADLFLYRSIFLE